MKVQIEVDADVLQLMANCFSLAAAQMNGDIEGAILAWQHASAGASVPGIVDRANAFMIEITAKLIPAGIKTITEEEIFPERAAKNN